MTETWWYFLLDKVAEQLSWYNHVTCLQDAEDAVSYLSLALAAAIEVGNEEFQLLLMGKLSDVYGKFLCDEEQADIFIKQILQLGNNQACT